MRTALGSFRERPKKNAIKKNTDTHKRHLLVPLSFHSFLASKYLAFDIQCRYKTTPKVVTKRHLTKSLASFEGGRSSLCSSRNGKGKVNSSSAHLPLPGPTLQWPSISRPRQLTGIGLALDWHWTGIELARWLSTDKACLVAAPKPFVWPAAAR